MVLHVIVLVVLALITMTPEAADSLRHLVVMSSESPQLDPLEVPDDPADDLSLSEPQLIAAPEAAPESIDIATVDRVAALPGTIELGAVGLEIAPRDHLLESIGSRPGGSLSGRGAAKAALLAEAGGNEMSEQAVAKALKWLAEHQFRDGGWNLAFAGHPGCRGRCRNVASPLAETRNAATALALLPFLGAGHTHKSGEYTTTVRKGLYFLIKRMQQTRQGGSLFEPGGRMYSHGLASIVLCEAYAMTNDRNLYDPAQQAVNFICFAQDPIGGGWRYVPQQSGDTSVVGWQLMALKSGLMGYLEIPPLVVKRASLFLDTVQGDDGATYRYRPGYALPGEEQQDATSAIGLLCRMYLGWKKDVPALERGVQMLSDAGPSPTDMYYNYYATQVLRHWEGDLWKKWNVVMRDRLIESQATKGHEAGSWYVGGGDRSNELAGRLYCTAMATMILEVYYRHLPIYRKQSTEHDFPVDGGDRHD